jgi:hypothetical protein
LISSQLQHHVVVDLNDGGLDEIISGSG